MKLTVQDLDYYTALKVIGWEVEVRHTQNNARLIFWLDPDQKYNISGVKNPQKPYVLKPGQYVLSGEDEYEVISVTPPIKTDFKFMGNKKLRPKVYFSTGTLIDTFLQKVCSNDNEFDYDKSKQLMGTYHILSIETAYAGLLVTTVFGDIQYISGATFNTEEDPFLIHMNKNENEIRDDLPSLKAA